MPALAAVLEERLARPAEPQGWQLPLKPPNLYAAHSDFARWLNAQARPRDADRHRG